MLQRNQRMSVILSNYAFYFKQLFRNTLIKDKGASSKKKRVTKTQIIKICRNTRPPLSQRPAGKVELQSTPQAYRRQRL